MIAIIGAGMSGMFTARALARLGHAVTIFESDAPYAGQDPDTAFQDWQRPGVAQLRQPHAARSLIVKRLAQEDPDLLDALKASGMVVWNFHLHSVTDPEIGHDPELVGLLGRRPTLEIPVRRMVEQTPGVTFERGTVKRLIIEQGTTGPRAAGLELASGARRFDAVVDASGRRSKIVDWLQLAGIVPPHEETSECGLTYYSRYFRFRPGVEIPVGPYPSGPSASLPGVHYTMNRTDRNTFSLMLGVPSWEEVYKNLRHEAVFMDFVRRLPGADSWLNPAVSTPIWKVEPFAGLINRYRRFSRDGRPLVEGLYVTGDARFHTNPIQGWGMSFALQMSYMLARAYAGQPDPAARLEQFEREADAYAYSYYQASVDEDKARTELWRHPQDALQRGEPGTYRYFLTTILPAVFKDQWIFRKVTRRLHLLDEPGLILQDTEVLRRAANIGASVNQAFSAEQLRQMAAEARQLALGVHP